MIWGQQTFSPIIPTFPPPPTMNTGIVARILKLSSYVSSYFIIIIHCTVFILYVYAYTINNLCDISIAAHIIIYC